MKKILSLLILSCMLLLAACNNYLDIQPTGSVIPNSLAEYRALIARSYKSASGLKDRGLASLRSDEMLVRNDEYDQKSFMDIERWNDLEANVNTTPFGWPGYYSILFIATQIIENKENITEGSQADVDQLVGEAYLLRAYMHFLLVNLYGQPYTKPGALETKSIPLKLDTDLESVLKRNTVFEVYTSIQLDLNQARRLITVSDWEAAYTYRFSTASVEAFQSRLSLYKGEWQDALAAAEAVLKKKSALEDLNNASANLPNFYQSVENLTPLEMPLSSSLNSSTLVSSSLLALYVDGDLRPDKYFAKPNADGFRKNQKSGSSNFLCTFRTGEIYLTAAEAAAQSDLLPQARTRLLQLMLKRYTPEAYAAKAAAVNEMNKEALIGEILNERARELAYEGHRWFDLRRTTRPRLEKVLGGKTFILEENDARYTLTIPKEATEANPGLLN